MSHDLPSKAELEKFAEAEHELENAFDSISGENELIAPKTARLPTNDDIAAFSDAEDDLESAFDSISGENELIAPKVARLPTNDDIAAFSEAEDDLESAFDTITGENDVIAPASAEQEPIVNWSTKSESHADDDFDLDSTASPDDDDEPLDEFAFEDGLDDDFDAGFDDEPVDDFALARDQSSSSDFGETLAEAWQACHSFSGHSTLWERARRCAALVDVKEAFEADAKIETGFRNQLAEIGAKNTELEKLEKFSKERIKTEDELEQQLTDLESELQTYERKIRTGWLRSQYVKLELDAVTKAAYFESIVQRTDLSPEWWERVTILAMASATTPDPEGRLEMMDVDDLTALWNGLLPESRMKLETIESSVQFFADAIGRLRELKSVDELFSTGFFLDVVGYQISLREAFFRPEILYACADFHSELHNWLNLDEHRVEASTRESDFSKVYGDVRNIFKSHFQDDDSASRLRARLRGEKIKKLREAKKAAGSRYGKKAVDARREKRSSRFRLALYVGGAAVLFFLGFPLVKGYMGERSRDLAGVSSSALGDFHPMLLSASVGKQASLLVGKVDGDQWVLLNVEQRAAFADEVISAAGSQGLRNVMLYNDSLMVLQIVNGEIRYLE